MTKTKVKTPQEAAAMIADGNTVVVGGTAGILSPDTILEALEQRFQEEGHPRQLTVVAPMAPGRSSGKGGLNHIAHEGMLARIIGGYFASDRYPRLIDLLKTDRCEGYAIPMGSAVQLMTEIGSGRPGLFTTAGIETFMDPREHGGCMNDRSKSPLARIKVVDREEYLFYPAFPVDVALVCGTTADENGYISFEEETNTLGMLEYALAAKASGGRVIAQVKRVARARSLDPRLVRIPGPLVDAIVVDPYQMQISDESIDPLIGWNPFLAGALKARVQSLPPVDPGPKRLILRRAALELKPHTVVNLGVGTPSDLPRIALEENILDDVYFTNEHGIFGGLMASGLFATFVPAVNPNAIMDSRFQFNFYEGGNLDVSFLGLGEVDARGDVNVSKFGALWNGAGGFSNITAETPHLVICGSLTAGGLDVRVEDGTLEILREGKHRKFVPEVAQRTLSGVRCLRNGQSVTYVTERAVFELAPQGPELVEVAPGIDIDRHIRPHVGFELHVSKNLRPMPVEVFAEQSLGLAEKFRRTMP